MIVYRTDRPARTLCKSCVSPVAPSVDSQQYQLHFGFLEHEIRVVVLVQYVG